MEMKMTRRLFRRIRHFGMVALAALGVVAVGAGAASANHYHSAGNCSTPTPHGLVHGSSTNDSAFHARVEGANCGYKKVCTPAIANQWTGATVTTYGVSNTCNSFASRGPEGPCGFVVVGSVSQAGTTIISSHAHYSHYYVGSGC